MTKQLSLFKNDTKRFFGGKLLYKKRKAKRPFSRKEPLHLVFKSRWARGENSFLRLRNKSAIQRILVEAARKYGVKIYQQAVVGNHLHLLILCANKKSYHAFVSVATGRIAQHAMRNLSYKTFTRQKWGGGPPNEDELYGIGQQFWDFRPFSRVLYWGRDFKRCVGYVKQNTLEALGFVVCKERKNSYSLWLFEFYPEIKPFKNRRVLLI